MARANWADRAFKAGRARMIFFYFGADERQSAATTHRMRRVWVWGVIALGGCYGGLAEPDLIDAGSTGEAVPDPTAEGGSVTAEASTSSSSEAGSSTSGEGPPNSTTSTSTTEGLDESGAGSSGSSGSIGSESEESSTGPQLEGCAAQPYALICEDFEDELAADVWNVEQSAGGSVHFEDGAMRVNLPASDSAHGAIQLQSGNVFPVRGNHFFGRVQILIEPTAPTSHSRILTAEGPLDGAPARYRLDVNGGVLNSRYTHNPTVEQHGGWRKLGRDAEVDVWTCIEWEFDGQTNSMRYWFDGELDVDMEVDGAIEDPPWVAPEFDDFELGYHTYQAAGNGDNFDFWFDDLVLATERIGC